ncbi:hypothetical protein RFI_37412, partial [Reticulomyxa filosa]
MEKMNSHLSHLKAKKISNEENNEKDKEKSKTEQDTLKEKAQSKRKASSKTMKKIISFNQKCFDKNWVLKLNIQEQINNFICLICNQVANNPVEISCAQHEDMDEALIAGENCLTQFLSSNNNTCPVQSHDGCQYYKVKSVQKHINELNVICYKQFKRELKTTERNEEKQASEDVTVICGFKGKVKNMNEHLNSSCAFKMSNCWFKEVGCEYSCLKKDLKQHLIENMEQHYELVTKKIKSMKQTIEQQMSEIKELGLKNKILQLEKGLNEKKQSASAHMKTNANKRLSKEGKKEEKKWAKWLKEKNEKDKKEIISKFEELSNDDFEVWLLNHSKWKNDLTKENAPVIYAVIDAHVVRHSNDNVLFSHLKKQIDNQNSKEDESTTRVVGRGEHIELKELEFKEFYQSTNYLGLEKKVIKNALVVMIAISEYTDNRIWSNLPDVRENIENFKRLFKDELHYTFVCNENAVMNKKDVFVFLTDVIMTHKLYKNTNNYDALIMIISGHGDKGDALIASDGSEISIYSIRSYFDCEHMISFQDYPKIFFIDISRGIIRPQKEKKGRIDTMHNGDGFLMTWSTTSGYD